MKQTLKLPNWLTDELIKNILKDDKLKLVTDISVEKATKMGDNYTSDIYRINFNSNGADGVKFKPLIAKTTLLADPEKSKSIQEAGLFKVEIEMFEALNEMEVIWNARLKFGPECIYSQLEEPTIIIMEDLAEEKFEMMDRLKGLDFEHCKIALNKLSQFHATSILIAEKSSKLEKFTRGILALEPPKDDNNIYYIGPKLMIEIVQSWEDLGPDCISKFQKILSNAYDDARAARKFNNKDFNVLTHGDFWMNNLLFVHNEHHDPLDVRFVDFQLSCYCSPAFDILYFFHTSAVERILAGEFDVLIKNYVENLALTMKIIDCKTKAPTLDEFNNILAEKAIIGVLIACSSLAHVKFPVSEVIPSDIKFNIEDNNINIPFSKMIASQKASQFLSLFKNTEYQNILKQLIKKWYKEGLLDKLAQ